ncbi:tetratricopeptide repeat protein [Ferrovibrio sp.]|jgi:tetratricopeptide (TPR) repeat protein|uniref:tetratricopeptide repeat protein n=1 Tax=Ferrovibrio sp. TaxID=1917215 RepID=UPI0035ADDDD1
MRFPAFLALPLLLMLAQPGLAQTGTAAAAKAPVTLDELFDKLQETQNPIEAKQLERKIWEAWGKSDSDTLEALMQGGVTVMEKGDYKRAVDIFSTVIELKPDFAEGYNKRATVRFLAGDYAGSVADIERTLQLEPRHFGALAGLAMIMERLDNLPEALRAYRRALAANPHLADGPEKLKELRRRIDAKTL